MGGAVAGAPFASPGALASQETKMLLMPRMEDCSLRLIVDFRLAIVDSRSAPAFGGLRMCDSRSETGR